LRLVDEEQRRLRLLNCTLAIGLVPRVDDIRHQLLRDVAWRRLEPRLRERHGGRLTGSADSRERALYHTPAFHFRPESPPLEASRVTLDPASRDRFGLPRLHLSWRMSSDVIRTILETAKSIGRELGRLGVARLRLDVEGLQAMIHSPGFHHMGTTRAHEDPRFGVVDPDCRVHGVENLHVAGSSVFPTGGAANPTFTLVALAIRLADRLRARLSLAESVVDPLPRVLANESRDR